MSLELRWRLPERLRQTTLVKEMLSEGYCVHSYQLIECDLCEIMFRKAGHLDIRGHVQVY